MYKYLPITDVYAREILDSRGNPTIEVEVLAGDEFCGRASVPSGASTGKYEAVELRDKEERYGGLGVQQAADHVNARIAPEVIGMNVLDWSLAGGCKSGGRGVGTSAVFVSWRHKCEKTSGSDDEYHEWRKTCG